jgi:ABC-type oligopeptide transport system substrate-binding subunit
MKINIKKASLGAFILAVIILLSSCINTSKDSETSDNNTLSNIPVEGNVVENTVTTGAQESTPTEQITEKLKETKNKKGLYTVYSSEALKNSLQNTVLFFHATWCPSCISADKNLSASEIPD